MSDKVRKEKKKKCRRSIKLLSISLLRARAGPGLRRGANCSRICVWRKKRACRASNLTKNGCTPAWKKGLTVLQGDIESGLVDYPDASFDYVILNQIMQEIKKADFVVQEALRVGRRVIVRRISQLCALVRPPDAFLRGQNADQRSAALLLVRNAQRAFSHHSRFHRLLYGKKDNDRTMLLPGETGPHFPAANWRAQNAVFVLTQ